MPHSPDGHEAFESAFFEAPASAVQLEHLVDTASLLLHEADYTKRRRALFSVLDEHSQESIGYVSLLTQSSSESEHPQVGIVVLDAKNENELVRLEFKQNGTLAETKLDTTEITSVFHILQIARERLGETTTGSLMEKIGSIVSTVCEHNIEELYMVSEPNTEASRLVQSVLNESNKPTHIQKIVQLSLNERESVTITSDVYVEQIGETLDTTSDLVIYLVGTPNSTHYVFIASDDEDCQLRKFTPTIEESFKADGKPVKTDLKKLAESGLLIPRQDDVAHLTEILESQVKLSAHDIDTEFLRLLE